MLQRPAAHLRATLGVAFCTGLLAPLLQPLGSAMADEPVQGGEQEELSRAAINRSLKAMGTDETLSDLKRKAVSEGVVPVLYENDLDGPPSKGRSRLESILERWLLEQRQQLATATWLPESAGQASLEQRVPVFVLTEAGSFGLIEPTFSTYTPERHAAFYAPELEAVLARSEDLEGVRDSDMRRSVLRTTAWAHLQKVLEPEAGPEHIESWLWLGLSSYLSNGRGSKPESLQDPELSPFDMKFLEFVLEDHDLYLKTWPRPQELLAVRGRVGVYEYPKRFQSEISGRFGHMVFDWVLSFVSETWVHFLLTRRDQGPAQMREYLSAVLDGTANAVEFGEIFGFETPRTAEREYLEWLADLLEEDFKRQVPKLPRLQREIPESTWSRATNAIEASAEAPVTLTVEDLLALAWSDAGAGDMAGACEDLRLSAEDWAEAEEAAHLRRVAEHLDELAKAREELARVAVRDRKSLQLNHKEQQYRVRPVKFEDGVLHFKPSKKHPFEEVPLVEVDCAELAYNLRKRSERYGQPWAEAFARFVDGDETWDRALPDDAKSQTAARDWERSSVSEFSDSVAYLADRHPAPEGLDEARNWLSARLADLRHVRFPDRHKNALSARLRGVLTQAVQQAELEELCSGKFEDLGGGRYRITQNFLSADQLDDFHDDPRWFSDVRRQRGLDVPLGRRRFIADGNLVVTGQRSLVHNFEFGPPLKLTTEVELSGEEGGVLFFVGACAVEPHQFIRVSNTTRMDVMARKQNFYEDTSVDDTGIQVSTPYRMELTYDGKTATYRRHEEEPIALRVKDLEAGQVFLWSHSQLWVKFKYLVIEGTLSDASIAKARQHVLALALEEYGL